MKTSMKNPLPTLVMSTPFVLALTLAQAASAQIGLSGTNYTQDFNTIGSGLPTGWSVRTNATATSLGTSAAFPLATKSWGDGTGEFGNFASLTNNTGERATGGESPTAQAGFTNRMVGIRQTGSIGDPGAAFVLQITDTLNLSNLTFTVDLNLLRSNSASTTWTIDYAVGSSPDSFRTLGSFADPGVVGSYPTNFTLDADADNQPDNVWIRIAALSASTGGGFRDSFGIDNFMLNYEGVAVPAPIPLNIRQVGGEAVLSWANPIFNLQSAPLVTGTYTNVPRATSPHTNPIMGDLKYFRLKYP